MMPPADFFRAWRHRTTVHESLNSVTRVVAAIIRSFSIFLFSLHVLVMNRICGAGRQSLTALRCADTQAVIGE
jgi:hypothetical protein